MNRKVVKSRHKHDTINHKKRRHNDEQICAMARIVISTTKARTRTISRMQLQASDGSVSLCVRAKKKRGNICMLLRNCTPIRFTFNIFFISITFSFDPLSPALVLAFVPTRCLATSVHVCVWGNVMRLHFLCHRCW